MLEQQATDILQMGGHARIIAMGAIVVFAYLTDFLCCRFIVPLVRKVAHRTVFKWDNYLTEGKALDYAFHLIPPLLFLITIPLLFPDPALWKRLVLRGLYIYLIAVSCGLVCEFISSIYAISSETEALRNKPLKGIYQMLKVAVVCVGVILIIGVLVDKDFTALIAGLGASAAVLMLIFKDTILGVVAGVQLSAYDMLRPGDWIMLEKYDINGEVEEVNMNTVKVRNWDNTITTIPPYTLVSDSFKNWRGMRESGGRRVARAVNIDMNSIRFCTAGELSRFAGEEWVGNLEMDEKTVNLKLFRAATEHYLRSLDSVNGDLMLLVRQLDPTPEGLPLQLYFFTRPKDWPTHERIAAEVMEHVIASLPAFGLRAYQRPAGTDLPSSGGSRTAA